MHRLLSSILAIVLSALPDVEKAQSVLYSLVEQDHVRRAAEAAEEAAAEKLP